jgi:hypothetical protein
MMKARIIRDGGWVEPSGSEQNTSVIGQMGVVLDPSEVGLEPRDAEDRYIFRFDKGPSAFRTFSCREDKDISLVPKDHLVFVPDCPRCEQAPKLANDYLCHRCRFGETDG